MQNLPIYIQQYSDYCCNLSSGVALIVWFTTNEKHMRVAWTSNNRVISIVACCHGVKFCAYAAQDFRLQQNGAVTRTWRSCQVQPSHKKNMRSVWFVVKRRGCCCNLSGGVALIVWFTTNGMCTKNKNMCVARTSHNSNNRDHSIIACCHGAKLCAYAAWDFWLQHFPRFLQLRVLSNHKKNNVNV